MLMSPPTEALQRITRLAPHAEVLARIDAVVPPVSPRDLAPAKAIGSTLATDVAVGFDLPTAPTALRDGWAVAAEQVADAGPYTPAPVAPPPAWVEAGEAMPAGTDAVLPLDALSVTKAGAEALAAAVPGDGVLLAGEQAAQGVVLRFAGEELRPLDSAILRAAGVSTISVRWPRVKIFCASAPTRGPADIFSPLLARALERDGCIAEVAQSASLEALLVDRACDAVVTIGGTGTGRRDASVRTLARVGKVEIHGFGIAPGETTAFGMVDRRPILMLPGRLDAALAAYLLVGRPLIARLAARRPFEPAVPVTLARKITSTAGIAQAVFVQQIGDEVEPLGSSLFSWSALARADGWIFVPPESEGFAAGATVKMRWLP
jgi:molybdopterin molybdotransferase